MWNIIITLCKNHATSIRLLYISNIYISTYSIIQDSLSDAVLI